MPLAVTPANVALASLASRIRVVQVGEAVTQGQPGYLLSGKYYQTDANDGEAKAVAKGIFLTAAATDGFAILSTGGVINLGAVLTVGETYVLSATKGGIDPIGSLASGNFVTHLGTALTTSTITLAIKAFGVQVP